MLNYHLQIDNKFDVNDHSVLPALITAKAKSNANFRLMEN